MSSATALRPCGLADLEVRLAEDLARLNYPPANWIPARDGRTDVAIVGGGMCGLTAAFALLRHGVRTIRILDRAQAGREGPWITTARMETPALAERTHRPGLRHGLADVSRLV